MRVRSHRSSPTLEVPPGPRTSSISGSVGRHIQRCVAWAQRTARVGIAVLVFSLLLSPMAAPAVRPAVTGRLGVAPPMAATAQDSSALLTCVDPRSGAALESNVRRFWLSGEADSSWTPAASGTCVRLAGGLKRTAAADAAGGVFVAWVGDRKGEPAVLLQRLDAQGAAAEGWPPGGRAVSIADRSQYQVDVASDGLGGAFLAWQDYRSAGLGRVYVQRLTGAGEVAEGWPPEGRPATTNLSEQVNPRLAADGAGGAYLVWLDRRSRTLALYTQHLSAQGEPLASWPENGAVLTGGGAQAHAVAIASDSLGHAAVVWRESDTLGTVRLRAMRLAREFDPVVGGASNPLVLATGVTDLGDVALARSGSSDLLAAWAEWRGPEARIQVQRLSLASGLGAEWPDAGVTVRNGPVGHDPPAVTSDGSGGAVIAWADWRDTTGSDIYAQRVTSAGSVAEGWSPAGVPVTVASGCQFAPTLVADRAGGVVVSWSDASASGRRGSPSVAGAQGESSRLIEAKATPGHARIVWRLTTLSPRDTLDVERRPRGEEWSTLSRLAPDDSGQVVFHDPGAPEGVRVEYRLARTWEGMRILYPTVELEIPRRPAVLALHWVRAEPSTGAITAALALPSHVPATLQLHDVSGRRVASQSLQGLEPGEHKVVFGVQRRLASGIYFVRLTQAGKSLVAKLAVVR